MTNSQQGLDPDVHFIQRLEVELQSLLRRQELTSAQHAGRGRPRRILVLAVFCLLSMAIGAAGTVMMTEAPGTDRLALLRVNASVAIARAKESQLKQQRTNLAALVEDGSASQQELRETDEQLIDASERRQLAELNADEVRSRGGAARDDFSARKVGDRDYVSERIDVRLDAENARMQLLLAKQDDLRSIEATALPPDALLNVQNAIAIGQRQITLLQELQTLRHEMVGDLIFQRTNLAELRAMQLQRQAEFDILKLQEATVRKRLTEIEELVESGAVSRQQLQQAEGDLRILGLRISLLQTELDVLDELVADAQTKEQERT